MKRSIVRPALASIALHAGLFALLVTVAFEGGPPRRPAVISAHLVAVEELGPDAPDSRGDAAAEALDAAPLSSAAPALSKRETSDRLEEIIDSAPPKLAFIESPQTRDKGPEHAVAPEPVPAQEPPVAAQLEPPDRTPAPRDVAVLPARLKTAPIVEPIPEPHQEMLEAKFSSLSQRLTEDDPARSVSWHHDGREYTAQLEHQTDPDGTGLDQLIVKVSTEQDGRRLATQMRLTRLGFSSFAQFMDRPALFEDVFFHDDEIEGRFHSNSEILIDHDGKSTPVFRGPVTTAAFVRKEGIGYVDNDQMFRGGLQTRVRRIALRRNGEPTTSDRERVQRFEEDARITFYADGSYGWSLAETPQDEQRRTISGGAHYIVGGKGAVLRVKGVVRGRVLVYSPRRIVIEDDLIYAHDPEATPNAPDFLGLVCDGTIEIAEADITGRGDLTVHAAIYAKWLFAVSGYARKEDATLHIYGSLAAGSITPTEPRFATRILYDERFERMRPPGFPQTDRYELASWDRAWTVETPDAEVMGQRQSGPISERASALNSD